MKFSLQTLLLAPLALTPLFLTARPPAFAFWIHPLVAGSGLFVVYVSTATAIFLASRIRNQYNSRNIISDGLGIGAVAGMLCLAMMMTPIMINSLNDMTFPLLSTLICIVLFGSTGGSLTGASTAFIIDVGLAFVSPDFRRQLRSKRLQAKTEP
ncbi:hypothetical protein LOC67_24820 [Stieleria sp. JC731]|uniref:hypothetical protein n=1 Tax=Stieleria sp. JC731 TaxID=2894195 RepID=UPI001E28D6DC|nr:hypothetical protein [Stieleria sp. JC731]MCC9603787.1 hypothetical protein [Stieleria sp. JC731]